MSYLWFLLYMLSCVCVRACRLEDLMRLKQAERRERERAEEVEREKQRRKHGQELLHIKQKLQDDELKKMADLRSREKMEDKMAKYVFSYRVTDVMWLSLA